MSTFVKQRARLLAVVTAALAVCGIAASSALASETLSFVPQSGRFHLKFTLKDENIEFSAGNNAEFYCTTLTGEGEITGPKTATMKPVLKGCNTVGFGGKCQSHGAAAGEIVPETIPVELVYTSKEHHEAGLDLHYEEPSKGFPPPEPKQFASWTCGEFGPFGIRGSIVAPVTPVNTQAETHKLKLAEKSGKQTPASYETEAGSSFEASPQFLFSGSWLKEVAVWSPSEVELKSLAGEGKLEIKA